MNDWNDLVNNADALSSCDDSSCKNLPVPRLFPTLCRYLSVFLPSPCCWILPFSPTQAVTRLYFWHSSAHPDTTHIILSSPVFQGSDDGWLPDRPLVSSPRNSSGIRSFWPRHAACRHTSVHTLTFLACFLWQIVLDIYVFPALIGLSELSCACSAAITLQVYIYIFLLWEHCWRCKLL